MQHNPDLNPLTRAEPLGFHDHLTLWNLYQAAKERIKMTLILAGLFAGALFVFSVMTALDDAHQRTQLANAEARVLAANVRALKLIDYLNSIAK